MVFGQKVTVTYSKHPIVDETGRHLAGLYNFHDKSILIGPGCERETMLTLLHELFHAIIYRTGAAQIISVESQEILCEGFANFVYENFDFKNPKKSKKVTRSKK